MSSCQRAIEYMREEGLSPVKLIAKVAGIKPSNIYELIPSGAMRKGSDPTMGMVTMDPVAWESKMKIPENMRHFRYEKG